jgi:PAS domain S-box-containing protein
LRHSADYDRNSSSLPANTTAVVVLSPELLEALPDAVVAVDRIEILVPEGYRGRHRQHREKFSESPKTRRMGADLDLYGRRRNGTEFPVEISLSPVSTDKGICVLSAIRDISDRQRIAEELRRANEELHRKSAEQLGEYRTRLAAIVDSSEDAILSKDLDGTVTTWNKGAERLYGYTPEEILGKNISLLAPTDRLDELQQILQRIANGELVDHHESVRITKDGRRLDVSLSVSPLRGANGDIVGASTIARDMTAQKRSESHLRQSQKMEAVGRLAGGVAHDFNNILAIINACAEFLRDRIDPTAEPSRYVENIKNATARGASLTRQLLAFSRSSAIRPQLLDLNEKLKDVSKLLRPLMGEDIEILVISKSPTAVVDADPGQLDQIVVNLAVNARDAMPRGGKFILETRTERFDEAFAGQYQNMAPGKYVVLIASDTGSGMDAATLAQIFEPFFTTKELGKGTGLGLATVYGIVKQSAGHILVYSELGHGTTFKIYLPCAEHKIRMGSKAAERVIPPRPSSTILLVEDDEIMRSLTRQLLQEHGYTVIDADDGQTALEWAQSHPDQIDLLLTDVVMRRMNGPELVDRLSASHPNLKIVYMSGYTGEVMAHREVLKPGATLIEKPFSRSNLLNVLHKTLGQSETTPEL